jgi:hypothetical protein
VPNATLGHRECGYESLVGTDTCPFCAVLPCFLSTDPPFRGFYFIPTTESQSSESGPHLAVEDNYMELCGVFTYTKSSCVSCGTVILI